MVMPKQRAGMLRVLGLPSCKLLPKKRGLRRARAHSLALEVWNATVADSWIWLSATAPRAAITMAATQAARKLRMSLLLARTRVKVGRRPAGHKAYRRDQANFASDCRFIAGRLIVAAMPRSHATLRRSAVL